MPKYDWQKKFYRSKAWRQVRSLVIQRDGGICGYCGEHIFDTPEVHHKVMLDEINVRDPGVSLNPALLVTLHGVCHKELTAKELAAAIVKSVVVNDDLSIDYKKRLIL